LVLYLSEKLPLNRFNISFVGAGRVGSVLCRQLYEAGYKIDLVVSTTERRGKALAEATASEWSENLVIPNSTDIVIVSVPDHSLQSVLNDLKTEDHTIVAHTAGSYGLEIFPSRITKKGVFYPLQTFSEGRSINLYEVPFLLESDNDLTADILSEIASSLSKNVIFADAETRRKLHLAAVFLCNFTNHMFTAGSEVISEAGLDFDLMKPLITETISKALENGPLHSQTGPAFRNDSNTIEKHLRMLASKPVFHSLYQSVTQSIIDYYKNKIK
jgi:predicted short-subunit dehydrogenase-like oxidoreductase (DUF2520 family)